jgi:sialidase-1
MRQCTIKTLKIAKLPVGSLLLMGIMLFADACEKDKNEYFYESIVDTQIIETSGIVLTGTARNMVLPESKLFIPDNISSGGYAFGSVIKLNDSILIAASSRYKPNAFDDFRYGDIVERRSFDSGRTWTKISLLQENVGSINTIAPDLLQLEEGHLLLFFAVKNSNTNSNIFVKESFDNGNRWSERRKVNLFSDGYYLMVNQRAIYSNGRIILPVAFVKDISTDSDKAVSFCFYSDDKGLTWKQSNILKADFALVEPTIASVGGNSLLMAIRTKKGVVFFSRSEDNGASWKYLYKSSIPSPESPQALLNVNNSDTLLMVWNNTTYTAGHNNRTPLTIAFSTDKGKTWRNPVNIQTRSDYNFFYPTLFADKQGVVYVSYGVRTQNDWAPLLYYNRVSLSELYKQ